jgi:hypothetical protein
MSKTRAKAKSKSASKTRWTTNPKVVVHIYRNGKKDSFELGHFLQLLVEEVMQLEVGVEDEK